MCVMQYIALGYYTAKNNAWVQVRNKKFFQGRGEGLVELGHFDKISSKMQEKKGPKGKQFGVFPPRYS